MSRSTKVYKILLSSPNDVQRERKIVGEIIEEINNAIKNYLNAELRLIKWETDTHSTIGKSPQSIINIQLGSKFDVYLGIMWTKFGTPTKKAQSGTEEEFNIAYKLYLRNRSKIDIKFYFSDIRISPSKIDNKQYEKVKRFKNRIRNGKDYSVFTSDYKSYKEFKKKVTADLYHRIFQLQRNKLNPKVKIKKHKIK